VVGRRVGAGAADSGVGRMIRVRFGKVVAVEGAAGGGGAGKAEGGGAEGVGRGGEGFWWGLVGLGE